MDCEEGHLSVGRCGDSVLLVLGDGSGAVLSHSLAREVGDWRCDGFAITEVSWSWD